MKFVNCLSLLKVTEHCTEKQLSEEIPYYSSHSFVSSVTTEALRTRRSARKTANHCFAGQEQRCDRKKT